MDTFAHIWLIVVCAVILLLLGVLLGQSIAHRRVRKFTRRLSSEVLELDNRVAEMKDIASHGLSRPFTSYIGLIQEDLVAFGDILNNGQDADSKTRLIKEYARQSIKELSLLSSYRQELIDEFTPSV